MTRTKENELGFQMIAGMCHEINPRLACIRSVVNVLRDFLEKRGELTDEIREALDKAENGVDSVFNDLQEARRKIVDMGRE